MNDISDKVLPSIVSYRNTKTTTKNKTSMSDRLSAAKLINSFSSEAKLMRFSSDYIKYLNSASMTEPLVVRHALEKAIAETVNELREKLSTDYIDSYKETDKMINNRVRLNQKVAIPTKIFDSWVDDKDFRERIEIHKNSAIEQLYSALQESSDESQLLSESKEILTQLTEQLAVLYETESIHVKSLGVIDSCNDNNVEKYMFISKMDNKTSKLCEGMNMAVFDVAEAKPMVNLPPLHPNCRSEIVPLRTVVKTPSPIFLASGFGQAGNIQSLTTNGTLGNATSSSQSLAADTARSSAPDSIQNPTMLDYALRQIGARVKELYYPFDESDVVVYYVRYNGKYYDIPVLGFKDGGAIVDVEMLAERLGLEKNARAKLGILAWNGKEKVSIEQLNNVFKATRHFQANTTTLSMLNDLNKVLREHNILTDLEIQMFLAVTIHESGLSLTEAGWLSVESAKKYCERYEPNTSIGKDLGNTEIGDGYKFRGAGYIQLTGRYNYQKFSDYIEKRYGYDPKIMEKGADYVAEKYAWELAGYFWNIKEINKIIEDGIRNNLDILEIFRRVSNAVNRGNADSTKDSGEWVDRQKRFKEVIDAY